MPDLKWKDAIVQTLTDAGEPMRCTDIGQSIAETGRRKKLGATPANTVWRVIDDSIKSQGEASPFAKVSPGLFGLRSRSHWVNPLAEDGSVVTLHGQSSASGDESTVGVDEGAGLINAFGMFWRRDKVMWTTTPKLLGQQQQGSDSVDFCAQRGVYLLYDGSRVIYAGRTTEQALGVRLRQHTVDRLNGRWDRFSWFGVMRVNEDGGLCSDPPSKFALDALIATMEALLIEGLEPPLNRRRGDDFSAVEFSQVADPEIDKALKRRLFKEIEEKLSSGS